MRRAGAGQFETSSRASRELPTSFSLPPEAVERLRAAAGQIIMASPDFQRLIRDIGGKLEVDLPPASREAAGRGAK